MSRAQVRCGAKKSIIDVLLHGFSERIRPRAHTNGIEFNINLESGQTIITDPIRTERVLRNLVENAMDVLDQGDTLGIRSQPEARRGPGVCIFVSDSGPGIEESRRPWVFLPGYSKKRKLSGTGAGLALSRRMVLDMGGQIDFESPAGPRHDLCNMVAGITLNVHEPHIHTSFSICPGRLGRLRPHHFGRTVALHIHNLTVSIRPFPSDVDDMTYTF